MSLLLIHLSSTYVLCLLNGNYNKLSQMHEKEMCNAYENCYRFDRSHVKVVDNVEIQDNLFTWNENVITDTIHVTISKK